MNTLRANDVCDEENNNNESSIQNISQDELPTCNLEHEDEYIEEEISRYIEEAFIYKKSKM